MKGISKKAYTISLGFHHFIEHVEEELMEKRPYKKFKESEAVVRGYVHEYSAVVFEAIFRTVGAKSRFLVINRVLTKYLFMGLELKLEG